MTARTAAYLARLGRPVDATPEARIIGTLEAASAPMHRDTLAHVARLTTQSTAYTDALCRLLAADRIRTAGPHHLALTHC